MIKYYNYYAELHLGHLAIAVMGETKDPGLSLFRRLKAEFPTLNIDEANFSLLNLSNLPTWMQEEGNQVLSWALTSLYKDVWPRADYQECLLLLIYVLGGGSEIKNFTLRHPGPDHHARWMSKVNSALLCF